MTPPLYLTRADEWIGAPLSPIGEQEWQTFASGCTRLTCTTRLVTMEDRAGQTFQVSVHDPVSLAGTDGADPANCLFWEHGYIATAAGQPSEMMVETLLAIAPALGANVQDAEFVRLMPTP